MGNEPLCGFWNVGATYAPTSTWHSHFAGRHSPKEVSKAKGIGHWKRRKRAEFEAKRDELREKIGELEDEISFFAEGISDVTCLNEPVDTAIAKRRDAIDRLEAKRDTLQEKIDAL